MLTLAVKLQSVLFGDEINRDVSIVYSPLNGTGFVPVTRVLNEAGFKNIHLVQEQCLPDGNFPTCPYPNPEIKEALSLGLSYCKHYNAELLLATDPDCDRIGIAVKDRNEEYVLLSGNEVGILLLDFICSQRNKHHKMPLNPILIKTIVTTDMGIQIARKYGVTTIDVLTGFKYIGEQISMLDRNTETNRYVFGFEESYGYLSGNYIRDKDGVGGALLICEMFAYYKLRNINLIDKLNELYDTHGYYLNTLHSFSFEGYEGLSKMQSIMTRFRKQLNKNDTIAGKQIISKFDFLKGINGLPSSDVIKFYIQDSCSLVVRPSGTEPKLKIYISVVGNCKTDAATLENKIKTSVEEFLEEMD